MNMASNGGGSEHQLGRVDLSGDENEVEFIETDESEDDDFSDHDAEVVTSRRRSGVQRSKSTPSRDTNMSSGSASRRFRRTSAKPHSSASNSPSSGMWQSRAEASVDQSVNLMDANTLPYDPEAGSTRGARARPSMGASIRQKSMVDIFLSDDRPQSRGGHHGSGGSMDFGVDDNGRGRSNKCRNFLLIAIALALIVLLVVTVPSFGLVASLTSEDNSGNKPPAPIEPPKEIKTTPAPTEAPQQEILIEEEVEVPPPQEEENVDRPLPEPQVPITDDALQLQEIPQDSRLHAFEFFVVDQDVTEEEQLSILGSPSKKALHWITQKDPAQLEIPGLEEVPTNNVEAEHALLQRYALAVFYYSMQAASTSAAGGNQGRLLQSDMELTNRESFDNDWLSANPICMWHGVTCAEDSESVIKVELAGHLLQGTIPRELLVGGAMPHLKHLDLARNQLQGTLPKVTPVRDTAGSQLGVTPSPPMLEVLLLANNQLTGSLDNMLGFSQLTKVHLGRNKFTGKIPGEIMDLSLLEELALGGNRLTGSIPGESLGELTALKILILGGNKLSEELPTTLYTLTDLRELRLSGNQFKGEIPDSYGDLSNLHLLHLDGNGLDGQVPTQIGQLEKLTELQLDGNMLTGTMPQEVCDLMDGKLSRLESDCADGDIVCSCCSECF